ncbi:MAG: alcohol dehydrogenase catalytic domain-containing protein [Sedimentisphaerales bacterium]|jgi:threonine dehydrogenase-like Zn-dependent dehydrogenase|nr:alcohol dehydrogenase catalytic domain-containing protein [Sedimentisphaerales bacterium]
MLPDRQYAVELYGPGQLRLVSDKPVPRPGPYEIVAKVEAVGLCFSDLKLLKQFSQHPRKGRIICGLDPEVLRQVQSYRPDELPSVPGHEAACIIVAVGEKVTCCKVGRRVLVQTDYRWLPTNGSNAAFGYNLEGALQQYVCMDQRVITDPASGQSMLIPVSEDLSASAVALVEPWACVESSYASRNRQRILPSGRLLVWVDKGHRAIGLEGCLDPDGLPSQVYWHTEEGTMPGPLAKINAMQIESLQTISNLAFDDIIYYGHSGPVIEQLGERLNHGGIINMVLGGKRIGQQVSVGVGRVHYSGTRWIGTLGEDAADAYRSIPADGQVHAGDRAVIIGAAGPMGQMHVIRLICSGLEGLTIVGTDIDPNRLSYLQKKAGPLAARHNMALDLVDTSKRPLTGSFDYIVVMVPVPNLVQQAVELSTIGTRINIFAGIPAQTNCQLDLDRYIVNRCYMFGTSGSTISDMLIVLEKLTSGRLDTNVSVDAIAGMAGAIDGIKAVEDRTLAGKIIVYPAKPELPLIPLEQLGQALPQVGTRLAEGIWTKAAEQALLGLLT